MTITSLKHSTSKLIKDVSAGITAHGPVINAPRLAKRNAGLFAGFFVLASVLLIIGVWQLATSPGHSSANASFTHQVFSSNDIGGSDGLAIQGQTSSMADVTANKDGGGSVSVTVNGQSVIPDNQATAQQDGNNPQNQNNVDVNINTDNSSDGTAGQTRNHNNSSTFVNSHSYVNSYINSSTRSTLTDN